MTNPPFADLLHDCICMLDTLIPERCFSGMQFNFTNIKIWWCVGGHVWPTELHVMTKNLQSIRSEPKIEDFCMELGHCEDDVCLFNETWRSCEENSYTLPRGDCIFLSGGDGSGGVGIAVSGRLMVAITYSDRVCLLKFSYAGFYFRFLSCYFPTSWANDVAVEGVYRILEIVLNELRSSPGPIVLGGGSMLVLAVVM